MNKHLTKCKWVNCILEKYGHSKKTGEKTVEKRF